MTRAQRQARSRHGRSKVLNEAISFMINHKGRFHNSMAFRKAGRVMRYALVIMKTWGR